MWSPRRSTRTATACGFPGIVISPYAKQGFIDHQTLSSDAYLKFIEDDFLGGARLNPATDGRPDPRPDVRENLPMLGNLVQDFNFSQPPRAAGAAAHQPADRLTVDPAVLHRQAGLPGVHHAARWAVPVPAAGTGGTGTGSYSRESRIPAAGRALITRSGPMPTPRPGRSR